jgi:hypothetical protein
MWRTPASAFRRSISVESSIWVLYDEGKRHRHRSSMVYRIVQLHDGEVEVQSTPGMGTRFRLVFQQA